MEAEEFLAKVPMFNLLARGELAQIASKARLLSLPGGPIVREGDPPDGLYVIKSGMAKVTKASRTGGAEAVLGLLRPGDSFGEVSLIDGQPRTADVTAMQPMECYFLPRDAFLAALEEHPQIARAMLSSLANMVRTADQWLTNTI